MVGVVAITALPSGAITPSAVRLHLGTDGTFFAYGSTTQTLTTGKSSCDINSPEPIIDLSSSPSGSSPGLVGDGMGVKKGSSNGTPCAQTDNTEVLKLGRGPSLGSRKFVGLRLDLEMTGNAVVKVTLTAGSTTTLYQLQTGTNITSAQSSEPDYDTTVPYVVNSSPGDTTDACAAPNSSGPNSSSNDNCQWNITPGFSFDSASITSANGTVSVEGSNDFGNDPNYDTLLYLSNTPPVANNDSFTTNEDTSLASNVLANDSDPDGNALTAALLTGPSHGSVSLSSNGNFTYAPTSNYFGPDSFTYSASDGVDASTATASITVLSVNDPPVANSGSASTPEDTEVTVTVATDVDSTALTSTCTSSGGGDIADNLDGTVTFTPPADFNGTITLTCTSTDDQGATTTSSATVVVGVTPVNDPPVANDDTGEVDEDSSVILDVLANDTDVDGDTLGVTDIDNVSPAGATALANGDGTVTYTPPAGYTGDGSFTYRATDGSAASSDEAMVSLTVFPVICSDDTVSDSDGAATGSFSRLTDPFECKRYELDVQAADHTVLFRPTGDSTVEYRGTITFGPDPAPTPTLSLLLLYDPTGGEAYQPVPWCLDPIFDEAGLVTDATVPAGETWCIASEETQGVAGGYVQTYWQLFGIDDPKFTRG
jgi:hypothetical protein